MHKIINENIFNWEYINLIQLKMKLIKIIIIDNVKKQYVEDLIELIYKVVMQSV